MNDEWYTPPQFIELARRTMGSIDTDPASCPTAQANVRAARWFTKEQDGLSQEWHGNVWCNPPYSRGLITSFVGKLVAEVDAGRAHQAVMLTNATTDARWFHLLSERFWGCFARKRIRFLRVDGIPGSSPRYSNAFFYAGPNHEAFARNFRSVGAIVAPTPADPKCERCRQTFVATRAGHRFCRDICRVQAARKAAVTRVSDSRNAHTETP